VALVDEHSKLAGNASLVVPLYLSISFCFQSRGQPVRLILILFFYQNLHFSSPLPRRLGPALVLNVMFLLVVSFDSEILQVTRCREILGTKGFMDFYLSKPYFWGFELLKNGNRLRA
jgi:hypothetical protein